MSDLAQIAVHDEDDVRVVSVGGEVDASNAEELRAAALDGLPNAGRGMILELQQLTYIDSAGIAFIFDAAERLRRRGQALALVVAPDAPFRRALEVTEIDSVAPVVPTLEAARAHVLPAGDERTA
jgi:stage II sporulation protein AA (anti-sigma F factor antagonist)